MKATCHEVQLDESSRGLKGTAFTWSTVTRTSVVGTLLVGWGRCRNARHVCLALPLGGASISDHAADAESKRHGLTASNMGLGTFSSPVPSRWL